MLSANLTLTDGSTSKEYRQVINPNLRDGIERRLSTSTPTDQSSLMIRHQPVGSVNDPGTRHFMGISRQVRSGAVTASANVNLTIRIPNSSLITTSEVVGMLRQLVDLIATSSDITLDTANLNGIILGES